MLNTKHYSLYLSQEATFKIIFLELNFPLTEKRKKAIIFSTENSTEKIMEIIKPDISLIFEEKEGKDGKIKMVPASSGNELTFEDDFFKYSHGIYGIYGEFTLCSVACEEWNYDSFLKRKRITCPECLNVIRHCRSYKL
jgi:hypothetical protein